MHLIRIGLFVFLTINLNAQTQFNPLDFVNPFIGTGGHGHTFPGASVPNGLVQLSPTKDVTGWDWASGYYYMDTTLLGFSHTHNSGTGVGDLGDILLMPGLGKVNARVGCKGPGVKCKLINL